MALSRLEPSAWSTPIAGISPGAPRVPCRSTSRPGWPSLNTTAATAPASAAFWTFWPNEHVPRCNSAMLPTVKPAKSPASQPLVLPLGAVDGGRTTSTNWATAVTSPSAE